MKSNNSIDLFQMLFKLFCILGGAIFIIFQHLCLCGIVGFIFHSLFGLKTDDHICLFFYVNIYSFFLFVCIRAKAIFQHCFNLFQHAKFVHKHCHVNFIEIYTKGLSRSFKVLNVFFLIFFLNTYTMYVYE